MVFTHALNISRLIKPYTRSVVHIAPLNKSNYQQIELIVVCNNVYPLGMRAMLSRKRDKLRS